LDEVRRKFGDRVADIVWDCTDTWLSPKPEWRQRKEEYLARLPDESEDSLLVSIADKLHNARTIRDEYHRVGDDLWERFRGGRKEGTIWYYAELVRIFRQVRPGRLTEELAGYVEEFSVGQSA
jgi:(p)ppGpp synthase/HD superfamily hydrolase